ncbi:MAG TPA: 50S ribosomal protein L17 [Verrucomicrobiae bacterium]|jgi:large subunit ribosomal protein L17|nr:50S ribosomal protein L17 [Verrucomicrobiae bacterium]
MRHLRAGKKFNRSASHRRALLRNLVTSLLRHERIQTTDPKAKELRRWADWMIGLGKQGTLHARRQALAVIQDEAVVHKLFDSLAARFKERPGGYSRIIKVGWRRGDQAAVSIIELLPAEAPAKPEGEGRKRRRRVKKEAGEQAGGAAKAPRRRAKAASA